MLGDIVHNEHVIAMIKKTGIKKVSALRNGRGKTLLIRAHGASRKIIEDARRHGYDIVDATCPMVKEIHKITKAAEKNGYPVIIIGDKKHDEVRGIIGQLKNRALVIDDIARIPKARVKKLRKAAIVVQSTQNAPGLYRRPEIPQHDLRPDANQAIRDQINAPGKRRHDHHRLENKRQHATSL
jgi:(E)-4-hydroxy-3-methyl-but-2-enyl pyrophosphate reductase